MTSQPETGTADGQGYLALFDPGGNQVEASRDDLLSIEGMSFDKDLHRRVAGDRSGRYWLISDRPGFYAMLLEVSIFRCYPREPGNDDWSVSYCTNGVASYPHWTLAGGLQHARRRGWGTDPWDSAPIPENVAELARQHVTFRAGRVPGPDPLDRNGVRTRDAIEIRERLAEFLEGRTSPDELLRQVAGKRIAAFELMLAVTFFCLEHGLDGEEAEILGILVPEGQHERLAELMQEVTSQLAPEDQPAVRYTAHFTPEAWIGNDAVPVSPPPGEPQEWDCTAWAETHLDYLAGCAQARHEDPRAPDGVLDSDDRFRGDPAAPIWIRDWRGPFTIKVHAHEIARGE